MAAQPLKRHGKPEDVAHAALYLGSDRSAQVTGMLLPVDGGITAGDPVNHLQEIMKARAEVLALMRAMSACRSALSLIDRPAWTGAITPQTLPACRTGC